MIVDRTYLHDLERQGIDIIKKGYIEGILDYEFTHADNRESKEIEFSIQPFLH